ncbi:reverse transcriptase domain-containing protein [Lactobacillus delbrueckii subsp. bulgaricus]
MSIRDNTINTKGDATGYDHCDYQRQIYNEDALLRAFLIAKKGSDWKWSVQVFESNLSVEIAKIAEQIESRTYELKPNTSFVLKERGKTRWISGEHISDRVVKHVLCDDVLMPAVLPKLIYDNCASIKGRGIGFARKRMLVMLRKYYRQYGNDGYILLMDYSKYYDNIRHDKLMDIFRSLTIDETSLWLIEQSLKRDEIDASYMTDEQYAHCMDDVFDSLKYQSVDKSLLTGEKMMRKHLNIGDQLSQVAGVIYPYQVDNYIKIVLGCKYYLRYSDDSLIIHHDKDFLEKALGQIRAKATEEGLTLNPKKTRIVKLSSLWRFMQLQYSLTSTGRVIQKINPKQLTRMRRKLKKLSHKLPADELAQLYNSWLRAHYKTMSRHQRANMDNLIKELTNEDK